MGIALPQGIGAAIHDSDIPTVVFTGDGGIGMFVAEVKLAVQHKLPLLIVLLTDSHLGTIHGAALSKGLTQYPGTIWSPSWVEVMEGLGMPAERVENLMSLEEKLIAWDQNGPLFLEIPFDPDDYQKMTLGIR